MLIGRHMIGLGGSKQNPIDPRPEEPAEHPCATVGEAFHDDLERLLHVAEGAFAAIERVEEVDEYDLAIEAGELNELFLWKTPEQAEQVDKARVADELADVLVYALMLAHKQGFDVEEIIMNKMRKNGEKYPVEKAKGNATKYTEL